MNPKQQEDTHQAQANPKPAPANGQGQRRPRHLLRRKDIDDHRRDDQEAHGNKHKLAKVTRRPEEIPVRLYGQAGVVNTDHGIHRCDYRQRDAEDQFVVHTCLLYSASSSQSNST